MLNSETIKKIETLVQTSSKMYYSLAYDTINKVDFPLIRIVPKSFMKISILDDKLDWFPFFRIEFTSVSRIQELTIIIQSGKFFEDIDNSLRFSLVCNNLIDRIKIIRSTDKYAHLLSSLSLFYNTNIYRYIEFTDDFNVKGRPYPKIESKRNTDEWNFILKNY